MPDGLTIAGKTYDSRLIIGTARYPNMQVMLDAIRASGADIVTVGIRRINLNDPSGESLIDLIDRNRFTLLPNTAGCFTARDAVLTARLAREALNTDLIKLEVIGDENTLFPDVAGSLEAANELIRDGFTVLPYCNDDPVTCKKLEDAGCAAIMPLGAPIGSGMGIRNPYNLRIILDTVDLPVIVERRGGHCLRRRRGDGARLRRRDAEYGRGRRPPPGADGRSHGSGRPGGPACVRGRTHPPKALRHGFHVNGGRGRP